LEKPMNRSPKLSCLILLATLVFGASACGGSTASDRPSPTGGAAASRDLLGGSAQPAMPTDELASAAPTEDPVSPAPSEAAETPGTSEAPAPTATPESTTTMLVRAYFLLDDSADGDAALVPVLRTVPESKATARAAMTALLAGPSAKELAANPTIRTMIPDGTSLHGVTTAAGVATVDLSGEFATGSGSAAARARLAQVVYTLTQFASIDSVRFELDGVAVTTFPPGIALDKPARRSTYRTSLLPAIFVDRPAWGAGLPNPGRVNGVANVFEAQFRIALLDAKGHVLVDRPVAAACGSGCWGTFDLSLGYEVDKAQWGTLRVWDPSENGGAPTAVRAYPVWIVPAS
jgi:germination protein M